MAKKKQELADVEVEVAEGAEQVSADVVDATTSDLAAEHQPATPQANRYSVHLACATPLQFTTLEVEANSEEEARHKFNAANGIGGSSFPYQVTQL